MEPQIPSNCLRMASSQSFQWGMVYCFAALADFRLMEASY